MRSELAEWIVCRHMVISTSAVAQIRRRAACAAAAGLLLASGCGGSASHTPSRSTTATTPRTVDTSFVEGEIKQQLSGPGAQVTTVQCPSGVTSEAGATFKCSVTWSNGATGQVKVTETTLNHYGYVPVTGSVQVPGATVEKSLQEELAKQGAANAQVTCPENIIVKVGTTVTCDVSSAGGQAAGTVTFTFSDEEGTVDPSSVKTEGH